MPRESCIKHSGWVWIFHEDYYNILGQDSCATVVLGLLEYWTNKEIERHLHNKKATDPWVAVSVDNIQQETCGHYGEHSIRASLAKLLELGIISERQPKPGSSKEYFLHTEFVQQLLNSPHSTTRTPLRENADPPSAKMRTPLRENAEGTGCYKGKLDNTRQELEGLPPSPPSETVEDLFCLISKSRCKRLARRDRSQIQESWDLVAGSLTAGSIATIWKELDNRTDWKLVRYPGLFIAGWLRKLERVSGSRSAIRQPQTESVEKPDYVAIWNSHCQHSQAHWNGHSPRHDLEVCDQDPDFRSNFTELCKKADQIHQARPEARKWLTLEFLVTTDRTSQLRGWEKLFNGKYNFMAEPAGKPERQGNAATRLLMKLERELADGK